jgi:hypothetical protein
VMGIIIGLFIMAINVYAAAVDLIQQDILTGQVSRRVIQEASPDPKPVLNEELINKMKILTESGVRIIRVADQLQFVILADSIFREYDAKMTASGYAVAEVIAALSKDAQAVVVKSLAAKEVGAQRVEKQAKALIKAIGSMNSPVTFYSVKKGLSPDTKLPFWEELSGNLDLDVLFGKDPDIKNNIITIQVQLKGGQTPYDSK